jgi:replication factor C subunit 3/5
MAAAQDLSALARLQDVMADGSRKGLKAGQSNKDAPWVEKYRPKTLDDVAAHKEIVDTSTRSQYSIPTSHGHLHAGHACRHIPPHATQSVHLPAAVKRLTSENKLPHLLLYGPPGTGKTSTIQAVARQMYGTGIQSMMLELNASDDRGISVVRQEIQDFASTRTIFRHALPLSLCDPPSQQPT